MTYEEAWLELEARMATAADEGEWPTYFELKEQLEGMGRQGRGSL